MRDISSEKVFSIMDVARGITFEPLQALNFSLSTTPATNRCPVFRLTSKTWRDADGRAYKAMMHYVAAAN